MSTKKSASAALQSYLLSVQAAVNKIIDPTTGLPVQVPDFETVYAAAGKIDHSPNSDGQAYVIDSLLGRANNYDFASPPDDYTINFPDDHHMHMTMGNEWHWLGCHLNVTAPEGAKGRVGILVSIQKTRCISLAEQKAAGWTDAESLLCGNVVTATLDTANGKKKIVRRNRNCQWPKTGGEVGSIK